MFFDIERRDESVCAGDYHDHVLAVVGRDDLRDSGRGGFGFDGRGIDAHGCEVGAEFGAKGIVAEFSDHAHGRAEAGCRYVIIGHSERRQFFHETDDNVAKKTLSALQEGLTPIVCVGETEEERDGGLAEKVIRRQFCNGPGALTADEFSRILLAYEPVWAIGTGRMATPELAANAHRSLRECVAEQYSAGHAMAVRILYGGSVKPDNVQGLMARTDEIDGALVGGASLDAKSFASIVNFT